MHGYSTARTTRTANPTASPIERGLMSSVDLGLWPDDPDDRPNARP